MNRPMRRHDREVTDIKKIKECLQDSECLHVGFNDEGEIYIVPVNFGYDITDNGISLYFHGAKEGRKVDLASTGPMVGFEMETHCKTTVAETACGFSELFLSIIGNGKLTIVEDIEEKIKGMNSIMYKATGKKDWEFPEKALNATCIFRIDVNKYTCKEH